MLTTVKPHPEGVKLSVEICCCCGFPQREKGMVKEGLNECGLLQHTASHGVDVFVLLTADRELTGKKCAERSDERERDREREREEGCILRRISRRVWGYFPADDFKPTFFLQEGEADHRLGGFQAVRGLGGFETEGGCLEKHQAQEIQIL